MSQIIDALTAILADTYALAAKTHAAHWNVRGDGFFQLHTAFGEQYEALFEAADEIAERIRALGSPAPAGLRALAARTSVADIVGDDGRELARALRDDHRALSRACLAAARAAQERGDEGTADLLIGRAEEHDKTAWMLDAYGA
ncbi:MAG: DNA starvation/stationary phase protection protein [Planctomycetes bacterium]|nr:DNA starvation/stationary phase protection protein [Planctomycetota bacterium]